LKILCYGIMTEEKLEKIKYERKMPVVHCAKLDCISEVKENQPYVVIEDKNKLGESYTLVYHLSCCPSNLILETFENFEKNNIFRE